MEDGGIAYSRPGQYASPGSESEHEGEPLITDGESKSEARDAVQSLRGASASRELKSSGNMFAGGCILAPHLVMFRPLSLANVRSLFHPGPGPRSLFHRPYPRGEQAVPPSVVCHGRARDTLEHRHHEPCLEARSELVLLLALQYRGVFIAGTMYVAPFVVA
jgi:hypothetical protein